VIKKVSVISGRLFNNFNKWINNDNTTGIFYETWTVYNSDSYQDPATIMYFDSFDCASWVLR
jgi:ceroid-lipofuscinosis neuronal protein 5